MKTMVRLLGMLGLLAAPAAVSAQTIPNGTLETWMTRNGAEAPANWQTTDDGLRAVGAGPFLLLTNNTTGTVTKSTDRHGGSFAAQLQSKDYALLTSTVGILPGLLALGEKLNKIDPTSLTSLEGIQKIGSGIAFTGRPTQLQFYYKLTGANAAADMAGAGIGLFKTVAGVPQNVASGTVILAPTTGTAFQLATVSLTYLRADVPDTLRLVFFSGSATTRTAGTTLLVDDVTLLTTVTAAHTRQAGEALTVSPNPSATGEFVLRAPQQPALAAAALTVTDATGRVVLHEVAQPGTTPDRPVSLRGQPAGLYLLRLDTPTGPVTRKLLVP